MALTANATVNLRNTGAKLKITKTIATSSVIYYKSLCVVNSIGRAQPAANNTSTHFIGIALGCSTNSFPITGTASGGETVDCYRNIEAQLPLKTGITVGQEGDAMYAADDEEAWDLATLGPEIGWLVEFESASSGWVMLGRKTLVVAS